MEEKDKIELSILPPAPEDEKPEAVWMSAGDIFDRLKCSAPKTLQGITVHRMGKLLRRMGAQKVHTVYGNRYAVIERDNHPAP